MAKLESMRTGWECEECGYPGDAGDLAYLAPNGLVYCGGRCYSAHAARITTACRDYDEPLSGNGHGDGCGRL